MFALQQPCDPARLPCLRYVPDPSYPLSPVQPEMGLQLELARLGAPWHWGCRKNCSMAISLSLQGFLEANAAPWLPLLSLVGGEVL